MKTFNIKIFMAITTTLILMGCAQDPPPKPASSKTPPSGSSPTDTPDTPVLDNEGDPVQPATEAPADLSYTTRQLIEVNSNVLFYEGENVLQPIATPSTEAVKAKILRKVGNNKLSIETVNGKFRAPANIDSGNVFLATKTRLKLGSKPNNYNISLNITPTGAANFTDFPVGAYITSSAGAKGIIVAIDEAESVLYIRFLTPTVNSPDPSPAVGTLIKTFADTDTISYVNSNLISATINQVEATNMVLTIDDATNFTAGHDITSTNFHSGYVYHQENNIIKVDEINRTGPFGVELVGSAFIKKNDVIQNKEHFDPALVPPSLDLQEISKVSHDNLLVIDRGIHRIIYANVSKGTGLTYSISPPLPTGLSIDSTTGTISGIAEFRTASELYVVTATNPLGTTYYAFNMEVRDYFSFEDKTGAKSFLTHKIGSFKNNRACRISANNILNSDPTDLLTFAGLDIGCIIEAEELDLFKTNLKLSAMVGAGICEYVSFTPFSIWQYAPITTNRSISVIMGCNPGAPVGNVLTINSIPKIQDYCLGNYANRSGPNCDTGELKVTTWSAEVGAAACTIASESVIQCGGKKSACIAGPLKSVLSDEDIDIGYIGVHEESFPGLQKEWSIDSPLKLNNKSNLRNANGVLGNQCTDSRGDAKKWVNLQESNIDTKSPFAGLSPFYEFSCLDAAKDVKARIRLVIRDWDRSFTIKDNITEWTPANLLMNSTGLDPFGLKWNNYFDWDDNYQSLSPASKVEAAACGELPAGECTDVTYTDINECKAEGFTWNDPGICSSRKTLGGAPTLRSTCEADGETWLPYTEGVCTDPLELTRTACLAAGETWTYRDFPFPGSKL